MGLRDDLRDDFPRGWWRSRRWWVDGLVDVGMLALVALATVTMLPRLVVARRHRDQPRRLAREDVLLEAYLAGVVLGVLALGLLAWLLIDGSLLRTSGTATAVMVFIGAWSMGNLLVGSLMATTIFSSRRRVPARWEEIDFIQEHAPKNGQPPGTVEEYAALRMRANL